MGLRVPTDDAVPRRQRAGEGMKIVGIMIALALFAELAGEIGGDWAAMAALLFGAGIISWLRIRRDSRWGR
jgi:hypothetical protein